MLGARSSCGWRHGPLHGFGARRARKEESVWFRSSSAEWTTIVRSDKPRSLQRGQASRFGRRVRVKTNDLQWRVHVRSITEDENT